MFKNMAESFLAKENIFESFESDDEISPGRTGKRRRITISNSSAEESDNDFFTNGPDDSELEDGDIIEGSVQSGEWKSEGIIRSPFPFLSQPGLTFKGPGQKDCLFYFEKFIDDNFVRLIVEETNKHAEQFFEKNPPLKPRSRCLSWVDTDSQEIRVFISLLILQGIIEKPSNEMYFSKRESLETPFFYKTMSEKRFQLLVKFIYFSDDNAFDATMCNKKTWKIDPILNYLRNKFKALYIPDKDISVDESLLLWKGRQNILSKRSRLCVKLYKLCESNTGYISDFLIYTGQSTQYGVNYPEEKGANRIVFELCHDFLDKGCTIYLDDWCTSIDLAEKMCKRKTDVVGTMRINRKGIPSDIKSRNLEKGQSIARYKDKIMIMKWKDKRDVIMLSTIHDNKFVETEKQGKTVSKPEAIVDYNKKLGGIDLADGQIKTYEIARNQVKKYYYKIFLHSLDMVCSNAYVLYKKDGGHLDKLHFLIEIVEKGVEKYGRGEKLSSASTGRPSLTPKPSRLIDRHFADYITSDSSRANVTRRCKLCYSKGFRKESRFWCPDCGVTLCMPHCFKEYHTTK